MSLTINKSSESMTHYHLPLSFIMNHPSLDDPQLNSFSSPRSDSATVIGKRLLSQSCISPKAADESTKFPIPIQSITRICKQKTQAKVLLKKKNLKIKIQDQPAPVPKPSTKHVSYIPHIKEKLKNKKKRPQKNILVIKPKQILPQTERSNVRMNQILKKSIISQVKKKKKEKKDRVEEEKKRENRKMMMMEKNSQIRAENFVRFKMEKFSPKAAWGVDERKIGGCEKVLRDIETQRALRKGNNFEGNCRKGGIGLSKFWEVSEEFGFKPRSSSNPTEFQKPATTKRESKKKLKKFIKAQKKKDKDKKENQIIQDIQKETKRIISLKELDSKIVTKKKVKKINDKLKLQFRPKKIGFPQTALDEIEKIYADKSSEFLFEPESHLREEISAFSEDSIEPNSPKKLKTPENLHKINSAVIKIQYFYRKFIKKKSSASIPKAKRCSESFPSSTQESAPKPEEISTKNENHSLLNENPFLNNENPSIILHSEPQADLTPHESLSDSLLLVQNNRYQSITDILQSSGNLKNDFLPPNTENFETYEKELQDAKQTKILDFSFDSYISYSEHSKDEKLYVKENDLFENFNVSGNQLVPRASPISDTEEEGKNEEICEEKAGKFKVFPEDIAELTELIIQLMVVDVLNSESNEKTVVSIDKDPLTFIDQLVFHVQNKEFQTNLSKPIKKNPLELLANMQNSQKFHTNIFDALAAPQIISILTFNEIQSFKLEPTTSKTLKEAQKVHDKLIFDNCNEVLQNFRPYGTQGQPAPWSPLNRKLKVLNFESVKILPKIARKIELTSLFGAGKIINFDPQNNFVQPLDQVQNQREEKIGLMILQDIQLNEFNWVDYEYEETQAVLNLSDSLLIELILETLHLV